ncbi:MAG: NADH-quinone oxidoreductase subunit N [Planctomycetaceae bacterium]
MTLIEFERLLPFVLLAGTSVVLLLAMAFYRRHWLSAGLTIAGLTAAFLSAVWPSATAGSVTTLMLMDGFASFYLGLIIASAMVVTVLAYGYLERVAERPDEFYLLLLLATVGAAVLVAADQFAALFLGLELLSVSLYGLIAYTRRRAAALEAGTKYLILAAVSSAFLLFGMALVYAQMGTLQFTRMAVSLSHGTAAGSLLLQTGLALLVGGVAFKLAVVPFHLWTPDVYQGAPAPVTAFVATVSKGSMFALLLRYFTMIDVREIESLFALFVLLAVASMLIGNLLALLQNNVKRMLAYSSIAHLGYLLVAFLAGSEHAAVAVTFYLVAYFVTTLSAFGVVTVLSGPDRDADAMEDFAGLLWQRPGLGAVFCASLLSLAGIPLTAGFVGKFYVLTSGVDSSLWLLVGTLVAGSGIGLYYYLRLVVIMCRQAAEPGTSKSTPVFSRLALSLLLLLLAWLGVFPNSLIRLIDSARIGHQPERVAMTSAARQVRTKP